MPRETLAGWALTGSNLADVGLTRSGSDTIWHSLKVFQIVPLDSLF
jgi:hypothetical protein